MQRGILKRLIYPSGGFVDFDFEANQYKEQLSIDPNWGLRLPRYCGGLRVRSISYYDGSAPAPKLYTYYRYGENEDGSGIMINKPILSLAPNEFHFEVASDVQKIAYLKTWSPTGTCSTKDCMAIDAIETKTTYRPTSHHDYTYANGSPIFYTMVTEYKQDLGQQSGKTVYEYYHPETFHDALEAPMRDRERIPGTDLHYIRTNWMEGAQKSQSVYEFTQDAGFRLQQRKKFEYRRVIKSQVSVAYAYFKTIYSVVTAGFDGGQQALYDNSYSFVNPPVEDLTEYALGEYGVPVGKLLLEKETEEVFDGPTNVLTTIKNYYYDNSQYLQLSRVLTTNTKGQSIAKTIKYAYDFSSVYDQMRTRNMISQPVEEIEINQTTGVEISRIKTNYAVFPVGWDIIAPENVQRSTGGGALQTEIVFNKYDQYGNVLQLTGRDGVPVSYLWGYQHLYPVAEMKGVEYNEIPALFLSNTGIISPVSDDALRILLTDLRGSFAGNDKMINTYTHKRLVGMTSHTAPNGLVSYYEYDSYGRLVTIKNNELHVVKSHFYEITGPSANSLTPWYLNIPLMRTHNVACNNGSSTVWQVYNYYVPAGKYIGAFEQGNDVMAENDADNVNDPPMLPPCPSFSDLGTIQLFSIYDAWFAVPGKMYIDFIQNGAVVASQSFKYNDVTLPPFESKTLRLPPGEYKVSFRPDPGTHYFSVFLDFSFIDVGAGTGRGLQSIDTITIEKDKTYEINVTNIM